MEAPAPTLAALVLVPTQGEPAAPAEEQSSPFSSLLFPLVMMAVLFYVIMLGPERKQRKQREAMLSAMKKGDRVMTSSGLYGTVAIVGDDVITLQVADGVRLRFARTSIQSVLDAEEPTDKAAKDAKGKKEKAANGA